MTYYKWFEDGLISMLTMWYCIYDVLAKRFESYPTIEEMWDQLGIWFDQIHPPRKTPNLRVVLPKGQTVKVNRE